MVVIGFVYELGCSPKTVVLGVFRLLEVGGSNLNPKSTQWNNLLEGWLFQPPQDTAIGIPIVCLSRSRASYCEHHPALGSSRKTKHITSNAIPTHITASSFLYFQPRFFFEARRYTMKPRTTRMMLPETLPALYVLNFSSPAVPSNW